MEERLSGRKKFESLKIGLYFLLLLIERLVHEHLKIFMSYAFYNFSSNFECTNYEDFMSYASYCFLSVLKWAKFENFVICAFYLLSLRIQNWKIS